MKSPGLKLRRQLMSNSSYQPIDEKLKSELFKRLCFEKIPVKIFLDKGVIESKTSEVSVNNKIFISYHLPTINKNILQNTEVECHFSIDNFMYFFRGHPTYANGSIIFSLPHVIYKIQRRENFRVHIPISLQQDVQLRRERNSIVNFNNISLTGGQITVRNPAIGLASDRFKLNETLELKISILDFEEQIIHCVIKYVDSKPKIGLATCGVQFQNLDAQKTEALQSLISKIDRLNRQIAA